MPYPRASSGRAGLAPLGESAGASVLEVLPGREVPVLVEVVVDGAVKGGELLHTSHPAEPQHRPLASSGWQVGVLDPVVGAAADLVLVVCTDRLERCAA